MSEKILELKPCPFCGKPPSILKNMGTVFCGNDACFGPQSTAERLEDSAVQWNTRASSPAQEPVTTEPVAWTNEAQLGFLKEPGYRVVPMAMWAFQHSAHPIALYAIPAPPQPGRQEIRKKAAEAIRTFCKSLGNDTIAMSSDGMERIYYSGISVEALAVAVTLALTGEPK